MKKTIVFLVVLAFSLHTKLVWAQTPASTPIPDSASVAKMPNDSAKVVAFIALSEAKLKTSFNGGKRFAQDALKVAEQIDFNNGKSLARMQIARCESYLGNFKEAFEQYNLAYQYYVEQGNKRKQASVLNRMGETKRNMDEYEEALTYLQSSLDLNREIGDTNEMGSCFISIGILHSVQGNPKAGEKYFLQAIDCFKAIGNESRRYLTILNMASLYNELEEYDKAIEFGLQARDYLQANGPEIRLGVCYFNLANSYEKKNDLTNARKFYMLGLEIFERLGDKYRVSGTLIGISKIDLKLGDLALALKNAKTGLDGAKEVGNLSLQISAYDHISNIYLAQKNFEKTLEYRLLYQGLVDSVNNSEVKERIAELEEKYKSEVKERELAQAQAELELQQLRLKRKVVQQRILIGIVIGVVIILLLLFYQFRTKIKINDVLEEKNALIEKSLGEKEILLKEIHHRVKNNLQFISSMFNLQARHVQDKQALNVLMEGKNRIHSMALVHQKLYQEDNLTGVNMRDYLNNLLDSLKHSFKVEKDKVKVEADIDELELDIDTAMPIGLLVNELITNTFKYAFEPDEEGLVNLSLHKEGQTLILEVRDNGRGFSEESIGENAEKFGFKLMKSLAEKLGGNLEVNNAKGVSIRLVISNFKLV